MRNLSVLLTAVFSAAALVGVAACSKKHTEESDHQPHAHAHHHHHTAPHGGTLVELGEHAFNLELVRDQPTGALIAYVLDAHAENFVRLPLRTIELVVTINGATQPLSLAATGSPATGETVGDTSAFVAQAEWIKTTPSFEGLIPTVEIRGVTFTNVRFNFPRGSDDHEDAH